MSNIQNATDEDFASVVEQSQGVVLVDFHASWCAPCKAMAPALDAFATERGDVKVIKVDVDEAFDAARRLGVRGVPTIAVFNDGKLVRSRTGAMNKTQLAEFVG